MDDLKPQLIWLRCFVITLFFYSLFRIQYVFWNWSWVANEQISSVFLAQIKGIQFDLSGACYVFLASWLLVTLLPRLSKFWISLSVFVQSLFFIVQGIESEMIHFNSRRLSIQQLSLYSEAGGKISAFLTTYWFLTLSTSIFIFGYLFVVFKILKTTNFKTSNSFGLRSLAGLAGLILVIIGIRGGIQSKPIHVNSAQISRQPVLNLMILNPTFSFFRTINEPPFPRVNYFGSRAEVLKNLPGESEQKSQIVSLRPKDQQNVVVIILESFSYEFTGPGGYTPFLDELSKKSLSLKGVANARRSIEGIGAIVGGIPHLMNQSFINSSFSTNEFYGLGTLLKSNGYKTVFSHGAQAGSMYFDQFSKKAGFDRQLSIEDYPKGQDYDGSWGVWDMPFFQWTLKEISRVPEPFGLTLFSLSSHSPFKIPSEFEGKFKKGTSEIHESIQYTDLSLREFFKEAEKLPWFKNTLFVITADHTFKPSKIEYENKVGDYIVPIIIFHPQVNLSLLSPPNVASQVDILPTVLDFLNIDFPKVNPMGLSLFKSQGHYTVVKTGDEYLQFDGQFILRKSLDKEDYQLFQADDWSLTKEIKNNSERELAISKMKSYLQYYADGMWDNRLYYGVMSE